MSQIMSAGASFGLTPRIDALRQKLGIVLPGEGEQAAVRDGFFYDIRNVAQAGTTETINFFQASYAPQTTNIKQPGQIIQTGLFVAESLSFHVYPLADNQIDDDLTAGDLAQAVINYINSGYITMLVNGKRVIEEVGLWNWPAGGGTWLNSSAATTASTTSWTAALALNGNPNVMNIRKFASPIIITPNHQVELGVRYGTAIACPGSATMNIMAILRGRLLQDGEN